MNLENLKQFYSKVFAIHEIVDQKRLQIFYWITFFLTIYDLDKVSFKGAGQPEEANRCWSFFQDCERYFPFNGLPESYAYTTWMAFLLGLLFFGGVSAFRSKWVQAHFALLLVLVWKFVYGFILRDLGNQNFEQFMLFPALLFMLTRNKLSSLRVLWPVLYFWAGQEKFHESWIVGSYFTTLDLGLPLIPRGLEPLASNIVILLEIFGTFTLISSKGRVRKWSFVSWVLFHLYSTVMVGFFYPVRCLAILTVLYLEQDWLDIKFPYHELRGNFRAIGTLVVVFMFNMVPILIPGDEKVTFEGHNFGFFMFDSNHQCVSQVRYYDQAGSELKQRKWENFFAMNRCDPWRYLEKIKEYCASNSDVVNASWTHDHSLNGGPFYRIIDEQDACKLEYRAFARNSWIKDRPDGPAIIGYPLPNAVVRDTGVSSNRISTEPVIKQSNLQVWLTSHLGYLVVLYYVFWMFELGKFVRRFY